MMCFISSTAKLFVCTGAGLLLTTGLACQGQVNLPAPSTGETVSFATQIQPIFDASCNACHVAGGLAGNQVHLTATESYEGLVDQPSSQTPSLTLVVPGDSGASLLFLKVSSDSPPVGSTMPLFGTPLSSAELGLIRDWIDQGALNN